jgi:hypothetical protein
MFHLFIWIRYAHHLRLHPLIGQEWVEEWTEREQMTKARLAWPAAGST